MSPVDHVLLTRFNLPSQGVESMIRAKEGWLRDRIVLFETYTVPAVRAQTKPVRWIVYFDPASPDWLRERIGPHVDAGLFTAIFRETATPAEVVADLRALIPAPGSSLVTTNLDNDDGLAADFVARVQAAGSKSDPTAVYLSDGLIASPHGLYLHHDEVNAFCSVRESWIDPVTCWSDWHNLLVENMPAIQLDGPPAWLQVVHGTNVSNRVRGRRVSPAAYAKTFGALLADVPTPGTAQLVRDAVVDRPRRFLRESGRAVVKQAIMRVGGKRGLDRIKLTRSALQGAVSRRSARG